jgi:hypothetical protein
MKIDSLLVIELDYFKPFFSCLTTILEINDSIQCNRNIEILEYFLSKIIEHSNSKSTTYSCLKFIFNLANDNKHDDIKIWYYTDKNLNQINDILNSNNWKFK